MLTIRCNRANVVGNNIVCEDWCSSECNLRTSAGETVVAEKQEYVFEILMAGLWMRVVENLLVVSSMHILNKNKETTVCSDFKQNQVQHNISVK